MKNFRKRETSWKKKEQKKNAEKFACIRPVFQDEKVIEKIHVLENRVCKLSDRDVQRVVRDLESYYVEICVYAMSREVLKYIEKALNVINKLSEMGEIHESDEE